ncbi:MAG: 2-thiouracil desulfurase family protein [Eubacteriales bacterium]|nr:2-thiouracil desulfurase family protein [Eubacteriales bacterium]
MFSDQRSKRIVFVSHCILNQNSISDGTADYPGTNASVLKLLMESNVGIIQLPCPELLCLGLDRGDICGGERDVVVENTRIRHQLENERSRETLHRLVDQILFQIQEYIKNGFTIVGLVGINRSPSCGIETTSKNDQEVCGEGVFIEVLKNELARNGIQIDMVGIKALEPNEATLSIQRMLHQS